MAWNANVSLTGADDAAERERHGECVDVLGNSGVRVYEELALETFKNHVFVAQASIR